MIFRVKEMLLFIFVLIYSVVLNLCLILNDLLKSRRTNILLIFILSTILICCSLKQDYYITHSPTIVIDTTRSTLYLHEFEYNKFIKSGYIINNGK